MERREEKKRATAPALQELTAAPWRPARALAEPKTPPSSHSVSSFVDVGHYSSAT
jgi:hypothetical protein